MSRPFFGDSLAGIARFEADRRRKSFPKMIRNGGDAEAMTLNYQAWWAIADFLETGSCAFLNAWGGVADPPVTVIDWPLLEAAAAKELAEVEAALPGSHDPDVPRRRDALVLIHLTVSRRRAWIEETNRLLREQRAERSAA